MLLLVVIWLDAVHIRWRRESSVEVGKSRVSQPVCCSMLIKTVVREGVFVI